LSCLRKQQRARIGDLQQVWSSLSGFARASRPKVSAAAQSNRATVPSAAQTKAEQSKAAPLIAGAALAGMGDRAMATSVDLAVAGAVSAVVGM